MLITKAYASMPSTVAEHADIMWWLFVLLGTAVVCLVLFIWKDTQSKTSLALKGLSEVVAKLDQTLYEIKDTFIDKINKIENKVDMHIVKCQESRAHCPHQNPSLSHPENCTHCHRRTTDG